MRGQVNKILSGNQQNFVRKLYFCCPWQPCSCCRNRNRMKIVYVEDCVQTYSVMCSLLFCKMSLFAYGSIHQGHGRFSGKSRGKHCVFMSLSAGEIQNVYICCCVRKLTISLNLLALNIDCIFIHKSSTNSRSVTSLFPRRSIRTGG